MSVFPEDSYPQYPLFLTCVSVFPVDYMKLFPVTLHIPLFLTCCVCVLSGLTVQLLPYTFLFSSLAVCVFPVDYLFRCYPTQPLFPTCCECVPSGLIVPLLPYTKCPMFFTCCVCVPSGLHVAVLLLPYTCLCSSPGESVFPVVN